MAKDTATFILTEATSAISEHPENTDDREFKELFTLLESKLPDSQGLLTRLQEKATESDSLFYWICDKKFSLEALMSVEGDNKEQF